MDLDAYVAAHVHEWQRLEQLTRKRRLSGPESDELVERYQQVATHLSVVRTSAPDASLIAHLSSLLSRARNRAWRLSSFPTAAVQGRSLASAKPFIGQPCKTY